MLALADLSASVATPSTVVVEGVSGVSFDEANADHRVATVGGRRVPVIGRAALIANKRASGRLKDLADVDWLERHAET
ncbi:MAG: hypothetical protein AAGN82_25925 [Myxococcota bacterium]